MEAIGVSIIPVTNYSNKTCIYSSFSCSFNSLFPFSNNIHPPRKFKCSRLVRMQVVEEEYELRQMKDMAAARKRWEALPKILSPKAVILIRDRFEKCGRSPPHNFRQFEVREGKVKSLTAKEAGYAIQLSGKTLLDVRPESERNKAWVKGSAWIPIFDVENGLDVGSLSKKASTFLLGGWWSGAPALSYNTQFLPKVEEKFPKDTDLIVACQKGLRSLAACELLCNAGYQNVFWIQGGLEAAEENDFQRDGSQPFKFAGLGGLSEFLGWTDQQRAAAAKEGWQYRLVFSARTIGLIIAADALFLSIQQVGRYLQEIKSH